MVKALSFFKRKRELAVDEFQAYWRTAHAALVTKLPGVRRYVQSPSIASGYRKGEPIYDGIAELWFDDTRRMHALAQTPEYAAVRADEAQFIDQATMGLIISEEQVIKDDVVPTDAVKSVEFVTRRPGMGIDAFQRYWREVHGPLGAAIPMVRRYVQSHTRRSIYASGRTPAYDGAAITWFEDTGAMRESAKTPEYSRVRADEPNFIVVPAPFIITRERVIVG